MLTCSKSKNTTMSQTGYEQASAYDSQIDNVPNKSFSDKVLDVLKDLMVIFGAIVFAYIFVTYLFASARVKGHSMDNTLKDGQYVIVDKINYTFNEVNRFDIVILNATSATHSKTENYFVKRIIGLPGEGVFIDAEGTIFINGEVLEENYGRETILVAGLAATTIELGDDEYFVLGDNRNYSSDSRELGAFSKDDIIGKVYNPYTLLSCMRQLFNVD